MVKHQTGSPLPSHPQASSAVSQSSLNTWFPGASRILPPGFSLHPPNSAPISSVGLSSPSPSLSSSQGREQDEPHFKLNLLFFPQALGSHFSLGSPGELLSGIGHLLHFGPPSLLSVWGQHPPAPRPRAMATRTPGRVEITPVSLALSLSPAGYLPVRSGE